MRDMDNNDKEKQIKLCFYCTDDLRSRFRWVCAYKNASMNQVLQELVENWLAENTPEISDRTQPPPPTPGNGEASQQPPSPKATKAKRKGNEP